MVVRCVSWSFKLLPSEAVECLLGIHHLICILPEFLQSFMQYLNIYIYIYMCVCGPRYNGTRLCICKHWYACVWCAIYILYVHIIYIFTWIYTCCLYVYVCMNLFSSWHFIFSCISFLSNVSYIYALQKLHQCFSYNWVYNYIIYKVFTEIFIHFKQ